MPLAEEFVICEGYECDKQCALTVLPRPALGNDGVMLIPTQISSELALTLVLTPSLRLWRVQPASKRLGDKATSIIESDGI